MKHEKSEALLKRAEKVIPGGVNMPPHAVSGAGTPPVFARSGSGARLIDADGNNYIDYSMSGGSMILGHASRNVLSGAYETLSLGSTFGLPTEVEIELAEAIVEAFPGMEQVRIVSSETEAVISAIHLAMEYTGRDKVIRFDGRRHGRHTLNAVYNDPDSVRKLLEENPDRIACVLVEPAACSAGVIPADPGFLEELRRLTKEDGALLIFDETISGFRAARGGAQTCAGIEPDLTCLGRIVGGGMPAGAFGGKREIMKHPAPESTMIPSGSSFSESPAILRMGLNCIRYLEEHPEVYRMLNDRTNELAGGLEEAIRETGLRASVNRCTGMCSLFFTGREIRNYEDAASGDTELCARYSLEMLSRRYLIPPSRNSTFFLSAAHTKYDIARTLKDSREIFELLADR